jgi:hypothetical protein
MRTADCPRCGWRGYIQDHEGTWRTSCPEGCTHDDGTPVGLRPLLHIPYDLDLFAELNVERYELAKTGKILFNHPEGANDDRFWSLSLAVYASDMVAATASRPLAKLID